MSPERFKKLHRCLAQLLYLGKQGRFDILYAIHRLSVSMTVKSKTLEESILYVLLYVYGTRKTCLVLGGTPGGVSAHHHCYQRGC